MKKKSQGRIENQACPACGNKKKDRQKSLSFSVWDSDPVGLLQVAQIVDGDDGGHVGSGLGGVVVDGKFADFGGKVENLGLVSANPEENYVQIPASTQFDANFTAESYAALVADMFAGKITVSNDITKAAADFATVITVNDLGNLK